MVVTPGCRNSTATKSCVREYWVSVTPGADMCVCMYIYSMMVRPGSRNSTLHA